MALINKYNKGAMKKQIWDKTHLEYLYWHDGKTIKEIAAILHRTHAAVSWAFDRFGIPKRNRSQASSLSSQHIERGGEKAPRWHGGSRKTKAGYVEVWVAPDDFFHSMAGKGNYVKEHRLVMAKVLYRCLLPWEVVHHKNGIKDDNRLENLQLLPGARQHATDLELKRRVKQQQREILSLREENQKLKERLNLVDEV